jgi:hypothetical protein
MGQGARDTAMSAEEYRSVHSDNVRKSCLTTDDGPLKHMTEDDTASSVCRLYELLGSEKLHPEVRLLALLLRGLP